MSASRAFSPLDLAQLLAVAAIWGANNIAAKVALGAFPPFMTVAMRFGVVLIVLLPHLKPPPPGALKSVLGMALLMGPFHFSLLYLGLALARDVGPMVIAMQLWAPFSVLFAMALLGERVSTLRLAGVAVAFAGVASMSFDPVVAAQGPALLLIGSASACYAMGAIFVRRLPGVNTWSIQVWLALAIAPTTLLASLLFEHGQADAVRNAGWAAWACALFGAVASSLIANYMLFRLVQRYEVARNALSAARAGGLVRAFRAAVARPDHAANRARRADDAGGGRAGRGGGTALRPDRAKMILKTNS